MSFYTWKDWERELDWMALNGVNLMLAQVGMEGVWQNTLRKLGYTDKEIADFIAGPAFGAWWLMGNLEGWGGPLSQRTIDQQVVLQQAVDFGGTAADKANALWNAKTQVLFWGPDNNPKTDLHDYANKEWSGMLSTIYVARWDKFIARELALMTSENIAEPDYFKMENEWVKTSELYASKPLTKRELSDLVKRILANNT